MTLNRLETDANLEAADDFYEALIERHQGLSVDESHALNARLVLILANHIGSMAVLREALEVADAYNGCTAISSSRNVTGT